MAKTATPSQTQSTPIALSPSRPPVQLGITPAQWERCLKDLHRKLISAIQGGPETGDVGQISKLVADIRAMDMIEPTKVPAPASTGQTLPDGTPVTTPEHRRQLAEIEARRAAASDPARMQEFNRQVAVREAAEAARAEGN